MVKKIDILGVSVDNYTVRESLLQLDTYMNNTVLSIIETVTMKQLMAAQENHEIKECLEQADLTVIGEQEILSESGNATLQRMREIRERDFMRELIHRVVRNQKRIFLIAADKPEIERMQSFFKAIDSNFEVCGVYALEECVGDMDSIVNEMNGDTPDMVISAMDSPTEEKFLASYKDKIGASVWYGIGTCYSRKEGVAHVGEKIRSLALRTKLHRSMSKYQERN